MKDHKVYELVDSEGQIVDVGYTSRELKIRLTEHTKRKDHNWYGREDLTIRTYSIHPTRSEALKAEGARKLQLGFEWTEYKGAKAGGQRSGKQNGTILQSIIHTCPHCQTQMKTMAYFRYHGDRCKQRKGTQ